MNHIRNSRELNIKPKKLGFTKGEHVSMKTLGETIKYIRQSKSLTQSDIYQNHFSRATFQNIENDITIPNVTKFKEILMELNVSDEEFTFIQNNKSLDERSNLKFEYDNIYSSLEIEKIERLSQKFTIYLNKNKDTELQELNACLKAMLIIQKENDFDKARLEIENIWIDKEQLDEWYWNDIKILSTIFFTFPPETAHSIVERLSKELEKYSKLKDTQRQQISIYLNLTSFEMIHENWDKTILSADKAIALSKQLKLYLQWASAHGKKGIALYKQKKYATAEIHINKCLDTLKNIDNLQLDEYHKDLKRFIPEYTPQIHKQT